MDHGSWACLKMGVIDNRYPQNSNMFRERLIQNINWLCPRFWPLQLLFHQCPPFFSTAGKAPLCVLKRGLKMPIQLLKHQKWIHHKRENMCSSFITSWHIHISRKKHPHQGKSGIYVDLPVFSFLESQFPSITSCPVSETPTRRRRGGLFFPRLLHTGEVTGRLLKHSIEAAQQAQHVPGQKVELRGWKRQRVQYLSIYLYLYIYI